MLGQRTNLVDASSSTSYRYDVRNRLAQKLKTWAAIGLTVALNYGYDASDNLASSSADAASLNYACDTLNRLASAADAHSGTTTYGYDAVGNLAGYSYPPSGSRNNSYEPTNAWDVP